MALINTYVLMGVRDIKERVDLREREETLC